jgi:hypothetical protein
MSFAVRRKWLIPAAIGALLAGLVPALSQLDYAFMPKGGKALLIEVLGDPPDRKELRQVVQAKRSEEEWITATAKWEAALSEKERRTLAAYLAINMPLPKGTIDKLETEKVIADHLPRDGRELGFYECMYCHSLFTSHLTQDRSFQAWMNMFESPFHREMTMTRQEREEFSRYSEINMPMKIEDVPPDLRF